MLCIKDSIKNNDVFGNSDFIKDYHSVVYDGYGGYLASIEISETNEKNSDNQQNISYGCVEYVEYVDNEEKSFCKFMMKLRKFNVTSFVTNPDTMVKLDDFTIQMLDKFLDITFKEQKYPELLV